MQCIYKQVDFFVASMVVYSILHFFDGIVSIFCKRCHRNDALLNGHYRFDHNPCITLTFYRNYSFYESCSNPPMCKFCCNFYILFYKLDHIFKNHFGMVYLDLSDHTIGNGVCISLYVHVHLYILIRNNDNNTVL